MKLSLSKKKKLYSVKHDARTNTIEYEYLLKPTLRNLKKILKIFFFYYLFLQELMQHRFNLFGDDDLVDSLFSVSMTTGLLTIHGRVDREALCPRMRFCDIKLQIAVHPGRFFRIITVRIIINNY